MAGMLKRLLAWLAHQMAPSAEGLYDHRLTQWARTPVGEEALRQQQEQLDEVLSPLFGYHLLELSPFPIEGLSRNSRINHRARLSLVSYPGLSAQARFEALPVDGECIDVVLLHHVLDFSPHPHQVLREASRALIPRGHLVIVGFNPWSLTGLVKSGVQFFVDGGIWRRNGLGLNRVRDWLSLLELDPIDCQFGFYRLPLNRSGVLTKTRFLERLGTRFKLPFGGYYILVARKERAAMTPLKPRWTHMAAVKGGIGAAKPSVGMAEPSRASPSQRQRP